MITGEATDDHEQFHFTIEPYRSSEFLLSIRYSGDRKSGITGAGVWPTVKKAKEIAQQTAAKLLHGAVVSWHKEG